MTLLFAQEVYEKVAEAYIAGLEDLAARGGNLKKMASVASFFISRIDTLVDSMLNDKLKATTDAKQQALLKSLLGKVAIANGKLTYQRYQKIFSGPRWQALAAKGAQTQRVLWASTSTKNPNYRDVMYVEELIGPDTVNTMPPATIDAFRDHGQAAEQPHRRCAGAQQRDGRSGERGHLDEGSDRQADGRRREAVRRCLRQAAGCGGERARSRKDKNSREPTENFPAGIAGRERESDDCRVAVGRQDAAPVAARCNAVDRRRRGQLAGLARHCRRADRAARPTAKVAKEVQARGFQDILLLGMGGSSLCPEVLRMTFGKITHFPTLHVLDSTDPAQVKAFEHQIDIAKTLFIVSSKSGSTLEPNIFKQYFFERTKQAVGADKGRQPLHRDHRSRIEDAAGGGGDRFRHIFFGRPSIGGRYSALSNFGMVPAAVMGVDTKKFLDRARRRWCEPAGRAYASRKIRARCWESFWARPRSGTRQSHDHHFSRTFPIWARGSSNCWPSRREKSGKELSRSTAKNLAAPEVYGNDRVFAYVRLESGAGCGSGCEGGGDREGRASGGAHLDGRHL